MLSFSLGVGAFGVFIGQFEKTIAQSGIDGIAGETAARSACSRMWKDFAIGLTRNAAGVPSGLSVAGA